MVTKFLAKRPLAGTTFNNSYNRSIWYSTNGATLAPASSLWFSTHFRIAQGSSVWWAEEDWDNVHGIVSDRVGIYWIAQPMGGALDLLISDLGGPWQKVASLDGFAASPQGRSIKLDLPLSAYRLQVASTSGTNYVIGPELVNSTTNGLHVAWVSYDGLAITQVLAVPLAIREPILREFSPDLMIWHFKETPSVLPQFHAALAENEAWFRTTAPEMDVLYIGTPYIGAAPGEDYTADANRIVRNFALEYERCYLDCMTPGISYEWMRDHNYMGEGDPIHPNFEGSKYLMEQTWNDIGFFALGADRKLMFAEVGGRFFLQTTLESGISYEFQSSTDLIDWATFDTRTGPPGPVQVRVGAEGAGRHYRLRMLPQP
ncbi:MAG: hypothetical protein ACXW3Z_01475 [Limisphaerales bacterium]